MVKIGTPGWYWILVMTLATALLGGCAMATGDEPGQTTWHELEPVCGDNRREGPEVCDGLDFGGETCLSLTPHSDGTLACTADCGVDTSGCHSCGDGVVQGPEQCEGGSIDRQSCPDFGYETGSPYCDGCRVAGCYTCGDGACDTRDGESVFSCPQDCGGWLDLSAGGAHTCAVTQSGNVWCWGSNSYGQLGRGGGARGPDGSIGLLPERVIGLSNVAAISAGMNHTCAMRDDGQVFCWGSNMACQLGVDTHEEDPLPGSQLRLVPTPVLGMNLAIGISAGGDHSCAVMADGSAWCWGRNYMGQLGDATTEDRCEATRVVELVGAVEIHAGHSVSCALTEEWSVWCWGANDTGQLGTGDHTGPETVNGYAYSDRPQRVIVLGQGEGLALGTAHVCAINSVVGTEHAVVQAWCWGAAGAGQLGDGVTYADCGDQECSATPVQAELNWQTSAVAAGARHSCAMGYDGKAWCWGANDKGQLGDSTYGTGGPLSRATPVQVTGLSGLRLLALGDEHGCAVTADRTLWCWGANDFGQAGGDVAVVASPRIVFDSIVR
jgi:alpha-tubulin suppressor-like RCC1 family protein